MLIDQLNSYIDHHKNKRAVALMIKAVNEIDRLNSIIQDLQKENIHFAVQVEQSEKKRPIVVHKENYSLFYVCFISIVLILCLIYMGV